MVMPTVFVACCETFQWHGVMTRSAAKKCNGMTTKDAPDAKIAALARTMNLNRLQRIFGTARYISARARKQGRHHKSVQLDEQCKQMCQWAHVLKTSYAFAEQFFVEISVVIWT